MRQGTVQKILELDSYGTVMYKLLSMVLSGTADFVIQSECKAVSKFVKTRSHQAPNLTFI